MVKYYKYYTTREEYTKAVIDALDETAKEATKSDWRPY